MNRGYVLCNGNSASSQMAEGWLRHLAGDRFEIGSANTQPVGLHAGSVDAMAEGGGIDISHHRSKHVSEFRGETFDYMITVCKRAKEPLPQCGLDPRIVCIGVSMIPPSLSIRMMRAGTCFGLSVTKSHFRSE